MISIVLTDPRFQLIISEIKISTKDTKNHEIYSLCLFVSFVGETVFKET